MLKLRTISHISRIESDAGGVMHIVQTEGVVTISAVDFRVMREEAGELVDLMESVLLGSSFNPNNFSEVKR